MKPQWFRVMKTYENPNGGFLAIGPRHPRARSESRLLAKADQAELTANDRKGFESAA